MSDATIEKIIEMLESLPVSIQNRAVEHLCEYLDEIRWEKKYRTLDVALIARDVRFEIDSGRVQPMDLGRL